ncbi:MAG: peptidylprolyl isomerase [Deltaproteobacteria bacterium]|nr:peptidylprolyl isomerase [Deltaproteobacteria bacterium]MDQ3295708.1 peptidylprolyl isomerase [Myxococcota bacterium]
MRSTTTALLLLALVAGCEHKNKSKQPDNVGSPGNTASGDMAGSAGGQVARPPDPTSATPPPPDQGGAKTVEQNVRAPVAADLAEYTKDLPGSGNKLLAKFETSMGTINCELFPDKAPMTVANFVGLATGKKAWMNPKTGSAEVGKPFFDGIVFHRVIPEFMIQGGDPLGRGTGGPGYNFGDEFVPELKMEPGTLAMANAGPGTNGSQFFITEVGPAWLNGKHTIFGKCKEVDLVKQIARVPQDEQNTPNTPITMKVMITKG